MKLHIRAEHHHARPSGILLLPNEQNICTNTTRKSRGERLRLYITLQVKVASRNAHTAVPTLGDAPREPGCCCRANFALKESPLAVGYTAVYVIRLSGTHAWMEDPMEARNVNAHPEDRSRIHGATTWRKTTGTSIVKIIVARHLFVGCLPLAAHELWCTYASELDMNVDISTV